MSVSVPEINSPMHPAMAKKRNGNKIGFINQPHSAKPNMTEAIAPVTDARMISPAEPIITSGVE